MIPILAVTGHSEYLVDPDRFTQDFTAPTIAVTGVSEGATYTDAVRPAFTVSDDRPGLFTVTEDLQASVHVRANRVGVQLFARVVLPEDVDPFQYPGFVPAGGVLEDECRALVQQFFRALLLFFDLAQVRDFPVTQPFLFQGCADAGAEQNGAERFGDVVLSPKCDTPYDAFHLVKGRNHDDGQMTERRIDLLRAVRSLPRTQREALVLVGWLGYTAEEAGPILGIDAASVRGRLRVPPTRGP